MNTYYLAVDIGASSGRHILGSVEHGRIKLEEVYRFTNGMKEENGHLCWDFVQLFEEIKNGMKKCKELGKIPKTMAIDTWGVDFVLLDKNGRQIGACVGYRDHRTDGIREKLSGVITQEELYERTGIQFQPYNTLNQLVALKEEAPWQLAEAELFLMTPDYFNYLLTGQAKQEYTIATTSQMLDIQTGSWDRELLERMGFPQKIFLEPQRSGTEVGSLRQEIVKETGFDCKVLMAASHDTASAVMAVPCMEEKALYISSGTWSLMGSVSKKSNTEPACRNAGFTNEGGYGGVYRFLKNIMGLWMIQSVRRELVPDMSFSTLCGLASKEQITSIVDCNDESFLSPENMTEAVRAYCRKTGQQIPKTPAELACVIYRSLAKCYADTKQQIEALTEMEFDCIYIVGGGSNADYLNELTAEYACCRVSAGPAEATAIGNLLSQMLEEKEFTDLNEARACVIDSFSVKMYGRDK